MSLPGGPYHFVGAGGAGMAPLGLILCARGTRVTGSDLLYNAHCAALERAGAKILPPGHRAENLPPDAQLVIATAAANAANPELIAAAERGIPVLRRGEFLAELLKDYAAVTAVSGAHGKTSITAMLAFLAHRQKPECGWMIGGDVPGMPAGQAGNGTFFFTEADESDGSHALLSGALGIVPNVDDDHAWSVGGTAVLEKNFRTFAARFRTLLYAASPLADRWFAGHPHAIRINFDAPETVAALAALPANLAGFQRRNALLVLTALEQLGFDRERALSDLAAFPGVERRLTERGRAADGRWVLMEDYAHHPAELAASFEALRERFPGYRLEVLFQPHRFQRLERYFDRFTTLLAEVPQAWIAPVFAAWCEPAPRDHHALAAAVNAAGGHAIAWDAPPDGAVEWRKLAERMAAAPAPKGSRRLIAVIGAGDVAGVLPFLAAALRR